ncbi:hypothetical protein M8818_003604 [Zalaria obscura]|uniref:Uncharacterized protein n=1 Tax=Zalaria obscura TaxID=2024903 RepID=A0ACC3SEG4_9PEZI
MFGSDLSFDGGFELPQRGLGHLHARDHRWPNARHPSNEGKLQGDECGQTGGARNWSRVLRIPSKPVRQQVSVEAVEVEEEGWGDSAHNDGACRTSWQQGFSSGHKGYNVASASMSLHETCGGRSSGSSLRGSSGAPGTSTIVSVRARIAEIKAISSLH